MKIRSVDCFPVRIPLKPECQMITALGVHDHSDYVVVRLTTDEGLVGVGEATVSERWSGETVWGATALIERVFRPGICGRDPADTDGLDARLDQLSRGNWFAKSAIEMACWDIRG